MGYTPKQYEYHECETPKYIIPALDHGFYWMFACLLGARITNPQIACEHDPKTEKEMQIQSKDSLEIGNQMKLEDSMIM